ncbi:putative Aldo-keto reductase [Seiridium cardinale]|uniref:Aldo-keto reductase n=1 Tax=Seiridium cardinale TaxID=138064 RepID=A0ABR2XMR0_9PEZI
MAHYEGIPAVIYGTAFKFDKSADLVLSALKAGFRGIDTAGSLHAYREKLVGDAISTAIADGIVQRHELWIQTKFSRFKEGRDPAVYPYDVSANTAVRVQQSIQSSMKNLRTTYLDSLIMHSPCPTIEETLATWEAMEAYVPSKVGILGISNVDLATLSTLYEAAAVKPTIVQNLFTENMAASPNPDFPADLPYPVDRYDKGVRQFCAAHGIAYTPWGLLWGNPTLMEKLDVLEELASKVGITKQVACFGCMRSLAGPRISILCGTQQISRMNETLTGMALIDEYLAGSDEARNNWNDSVATIQQIVDGHHATLP